MKKIYSAKKKKHPTQPPIQVEILLMTRITTTKLEEEQREWGSTLNLHIGMLFLVSMVSFLYSIFFSAQSMVPDMTEQGNFYL